MFWFIMIGLIIWITVTDHNRKEKVIHQQRITNDRAYEEFILAELTMTDQEKNRALTDYYLFRKVAKPYSGRRFLENDNAENKPADKETA